MPENTNESPQLSVNDLKNLLAIIDVASKRGAFQTKEFAAIGDVYARVEAFVNATLPEAPATEETKGA